MSRMPNPVILHIDDDEANRYAVKMILERSGYHVESAATGEEGWTLLDRLPDLIVLDIRLPDINGYDLCRKIKSNPKYASIPVLQTSATFTSSDHKVEGLESGADGYLAQPIESAVLVATVKSLLRIRQAEKMALEATQSREDMLAIVSHDLRNPLAYIMLQIKMMERVLKADRYENQAIFDKLVSVNNSCHRMNRLIQDLLDVSSIEGGKFKIISKDFSANDLLTDVIAMFEENAKNSRVKISKFVPENALEIFGDRERIFQVFSNLITNSLKFTPPNGEVKVTMTEKGDMVEFAVADTGSGIPQKDLEHVFDRFWQGHLDRKGGFGLGLSIVKGIIEAHHGNINIISSQDIGTTVTFQIPKKS